MTDLRCPEYLRFKKRVEEKMAELDRMKSFQELMLIAGVEDNEKCTCITGWYCYSDFSAKKVAEILDIPLEE